MSAAPIPEGAADRAERVLTEHERRFTSAPDIAARGTLLALSNAGLRVVDAAEHEGLRELVRGLAALSIYRDWCPQTAHQEWYWRDDGYSERHLLTEHMPDLAAVLAAVVDGPPEHRPRTEPAENGLRRGACSCGWRAEGAWPEHAAAADAYDHAAALGGEGEGEKP